MNETELTEHYLRLLSKTGEDFAWPAISFAPGHDGGEHVEIREDGTWVMLVTDRGHESERARYADLHDLMFSLCASATWDAAMRDVRTPDLHAHDLEDLAQARQAELMGRIDPAWAEKLNRNYRKWRAVRGRMAASDRRRERRDRIVTALVYTGCAGIVGATASLVWFFG